jgi:hypothetical protein
VYSSFPYDVSATRDNMKKRVAYWQFFLSLDGFWKANRTTHLPSYSKHLGQTEPNQGPSVANTRTPPNSSSRNSVCELRSI